MIVLSHPTGNTFVRAALAGFEEAGLLDAFFTTVAVNGSAAWMRLLPPKHRAEFCRRSFEVPAGRTRTMPGRELVRLAASKFGPGFLTTHESGWASVDAVYRALDRFVAGEGLGGPDLRGVYCYEDCALETFRAARKRGMTCIYDLPIAYWETTQRLLAEEAERLPAWEPTLGGTKDSAAKLARKSGEIALADVVVCPSEFVRGSLPAAVRREKRCAVVEFGSPSSPPPAAGRTDAGEGRLRVLFVGALSQRKGLADLFAAVKMLGRNDVELVVMGSLLAPLSFYRGQLGDFRYEPPRPHPQVLDLMTGCDVLVLPSIVEGRALVQQEAMSCGLPLIVTPNAGGEDLVEEGETGFLVPIRCPEAIAEKIAWFADNRGALSRMRESARQKAARKTWDTYRAKLVEVVRAACFNNGTPHD